uniref:COMM domain-containing protein 3 n=1 Tax=Oryzias sinensis TaxID=183150 RepID=A0A8C7ZAY7_9TELE
MELSESVQKGLQSLGDQTVLDRCSFPVVVDACFRSLLFSRGDPAVLDLPELKHLDKILLKQIHAAATTFILEAVKHNADKSTISFSLEELTFNTERIETFYTTFQKHKKDLELILSSIGRGPAHIKDVSWRLQYQMKNGQLDKVNEPFYLISLSTETGGASEDVDFSCTAEQLQVKTEIKDEDMKLNMRKSAISSNQTHLCCAFCAVECKCAQMYLPQTQIKNILLTES